MVNLYQQLKLKMAGMALRPELLISALAERRYTINHLRRLRPRYGLFSIVACACEGDPTRYHFPPIILAMAVSLNFPSSS